MDMDATITNSQLLTRYQQHSDEQAFEELTPGLSPMELAICRRTLGDTEDGSQGPGRPSATAYAGKDVSPYADDR